MQNNTFENSLKHIEEFYSAANPDALFNVLNKMINFNSGYIFFINPELLRIEYSYKNKIGNENLKIKNELSKELFKGIFSDQFMCLMKLNGIENFLAEPLKVKNTVFGILLIEGGNFSKDEKLIFKTCSAIIANIVKDTEINKIISMQIKALQEGINEINTENKKIKQADEVKTNFLSHVSHEIRTPLTSIIGYSDMLTREFAGKLNDKQKEFINDIQTSGIHLLGIINEILDMAKIEANAMKLNLTDFDISTAINEVCNMIKPLAHKKQIEIKTEIAPKQINADYQKIQQILFNLLGNAIKFTPENGRVKIKTTLEKNHIKISIKDNGIGITPEYHSKIFEKFEQIPCKNKSFSTGLGLAITKEFVQMHNGSISLKSKPEKGSEFVVILPLRKI